MSGQKMKGEISFRGIRKEADAGDKINHNREK